ncbi:NlpC/P60 family protein, partial [Streptomyces sp. NPDC054796]
PRGSGGGGGGGGGGGAPPPAPPGPPRPGDDQTSVSRPALNSRIDRLYEQAEAATEKFNGAAERTERLREQVDHAQDRIARTQAKVNRLRNALGALAGAQYRSGGVDPSVTLLLSSDPDGYLDKAATLDRISSRQEDRLAQFGGARRALEQQREEAGGKLLRLERQQKALKASKNEVREKLAAARKLLNRLTPEERAERERASRGGGRDGGRGDGRGDGRGGDGQAPGTGGGKASSARAAKAVAAVRSVVGAPYVWGAAGPNAFDCSGLTQWAYAQAGTSIPRTSQAQGATGQRVPMSQARPGDLVVYRDDASHVGMYVGGGQVVHAPYPGAQVRYDPVDMMPVSSVTRP